jgi:hypothetical protein
MMTQEALATLLEAVWAPDRFKLILIGNCFLSALWLRRGISLFQFQRFSPSAFQLLPEPPRLLSKKNGTIFPYEPKAPPVSD